MRRTVTIAALMLMIIASAADAQTRRLPVKTLSYGADGNSGTYSYDASGNIIAIGADSFFYDTLGRLKQATVRGTTETFTYDLFGNRTGEVGAASCVAGPCASSPPVSVGSNHVIGMTYDAAGSVTAGNGATYTYDGTGMLIHSVGGSDDRQYIYTADDERIAVAQGVSWTWTVRDLGAKVLREFTSLEGSNLSQTSRQWTKDYVWRDGQLLTTTTAAGTYHYHLDHEGTPRLITDVNHVRVAEHAYYPFGPEMIVTPHENSEEKMKYTGHERDLAGPYQTLDYMHARYYSATNARFLSVDPIINQKMAMSNPQAWNRYSYVANNPMNRIDPTGLDWFHVGDTWEWHKGHKYKDLQGYRYLMVATSTGKTNKAGAAMFGVKFYDQNKVMFTGTAWSGGNGHPRVPAHNYNIFGSSRDPMPTTTANPPSSVWAGNPPQSYGIQQMPQFIGQWPEQASYGPIRARLNPTMPVDRSVDGAYYHGQDGTMELGSTHGCLCYGKDTTIIQYIFDHRIDVHVAVDVPVETPP